MKAQLQQRFTVELTVHELADAFAQLDSVSQARFFCAVAAEFGKWETIEQQRQLAFIGEQLRTCSCADKAGRVWVRAIADATESVP